MNNKSGPGAFDFSLPRLFVQLLATITVVEVAIMWLLPALPVGDGARIFIDAGLLATVCAPLIWRLVARLRDAALENEGKFRALVEQSLVGISVIAEGRFLYVNPKHEKIFGYTTDEMLAMDPKDLAVAEDRPMIAENMRKRLQGEVDSISYSFRGLRKDGSAIEVAVHGKRTLLDGRPAIVGVLLDVTAQRRAEKALKSENSFISAVLDTAGALVVVLDRDGRVMRFNRQCEKATGYRAAEIVGKPVWERLLLPEDVPPVKAVFERLLAGNFPGEFENRWATKNGGARLIAWTNTALLDASGQVEFVIATGIDVTESRLMEAELCDSEARFRMLFNSGNDAIMAHRMMPDGMPGQFVEVNDLACRRLGYTRQELLALSPADIDDTAFVSDIPRVSRQVESEGHALFERVHVGKDGRKIPVEINTHLIELKGQPVALSIARDITERKAAEAALRESEARLREITSELGDGIYVLDRAGMLTFMNAAAEGMLGWTEAELLGENAHETFHFQKPDGARVPLCDCPVYQSIHSGDTYRIHEDYFTRKDGTLFPVSFVAAPLHRGGEIVGSVAAFQDIASRLEGEKALHESEEKFRLISTAAMDAIVILGPEEEITYWNPAAANIFGYQPGEALGRNLHELLAPPRHRDQSRRGFARFRESGEGALIGKTSEITALRKGGEEFPIELSISAISIKGRWHALGIIRDIGQRKKAEEQIHHLAYYDTLTDLPNRRLLTDRLNQSLAQAQRHDRPLAVMFLDLDHFKEINDSLGHDVGDELLRAVARRLNACVRSADTVSRQGGDEFVIVLAELRQPRDAEQVADKILKSLSEPIGVREHQLRITTSIGIAVYSSDHPEDAQELMKKADTAMYAAKEAGRNQYRFCQVLSR
ncbi:MAG: PAS domain S-box protein [Sulfuricella sp.]|nr:PAS domain S-box protein [Sulfuricella sp.]